MATKEQAREIIDGFLPAMDKIQSAKASDEEKRRMAKEWLRARLDAILTER
jgi:hypothetical protein